MIFFSIIIPTYNREAILHRCLDSLICQTYKEFEVIICDDGSTDGTAAVIERYKDNFKKFTYIKISNSGSASKPRNEAIKIASGNWICFLDSDDWWYCNKLQVTAEQIGENPEVEILYHDLMVVNNQKEPVYTIKGRALKKETAFLELLYKGNAIPLSSSCVKKETLDKIGFFEEAGVYKSEDSDFWIRAARLGTHFKYIPQILGYYLKHDGNTYDEAFEIHVLNIPAEYTSQLTKPQYRTFKKWTHYRMGLIHFQRKRYQEANKEFKAAISLTNAEISLKSFIRLLQLGIRKVKK